jgi:hypothetical protein
MKPENQQMVNKMIEAQISRRMLILLVAKTQLKIWHLYQSKPVKMFAGLQYLTEILHVISGVMHETLMSFGISEHDRQFIQPGVLAVPDDGKFRNGINAFKPLLETAKDYGEFQMMNNYKETDHHIVKEVIQAVNILIEGIYLDPDSTATEA